MNFKYLLLAIVFLFSTLIVFSQETFIDNFNTVSYSNNTGTANFSSSWVETNETTSPSNGRILINSNQLRFRNLDNRTITRDLDLSGYANVTLTLDFNRTSGNEAINVLLFNGSIYTSIAVLDGNGSISYDLDVSEISANSSIRFETASGNWGNSETVFIDNILFTAELINEPPVVVGTGNKVYCSGGSVSIVDSISITDSDDTETNAVYIQISNGYVNGEDLLSLTGSHPGITTSWDSVQGELTLAGPATYSDFEAAILDVEFSSSNLTPSGMRQFSITVGEANYLPSTGHYYEFVSDPGISWINANTAASNRTYFGLQGYLVTLTSQEEADFSGEQASGFGWIGATDVAVEGEWRWVTGPEAGTQFWQGLANGTELTFANWNGGEPNNVGGGGGEDYAHIAAASVIGGGAPIGAWNDLPNNGGGGAYASQGYVVEYGGMTGDPILNITATTWLTMSTCKIITNPRITFRVKNN